MGVDIFGRKPKIVTEGPKPIDCRSSSDEEKIVYFYKLAKWEKENPGIYFGFSWGEWRPLYMLCEAVNDMYKLKMNMEYWFSNNGKGLSTQKKCDRLADALELMLNDNFPKDFMEDNSNVFYMVTRSWNVTDTREIFLDEKDELNEEYEYGTILWAPVVTKKGVIVEPAYSCSLEDIKAWINFLRECGGFKIW
jgi:hypothetical protein